MQKREGLTMMAALIGAGSLLTTLGLGGPRRLCNAGDSYRARAPIGGRSVKPAKPTRSSSVDQVSGNKMARRLKSGKKLFRV